MTGLDERVRMFLETWEQREAGEIPGPEDAKCMVCGAVLEDGNFIMVDGNLFCLRCERGQEYLIDRHEKGLL